jgi:hypothetical protein
LLKIGTGVLYGGSKQRVHANEFRALIPPVLGFFATLGLRFRHALDFVVAQRAKAPFVLEQQHQEQEPQQQRQPQKREMRKKGRLKSPRAFLIRHEPKSACA